MRSGDAYSLGIVCVYNCGATGYPLLQPCDARSGRLVGFNFAKSMHEADKRGAGCHFSIDDYRFERVWTYPEGYVELLRRFECVVTPDFSVYTDMPYPMKLWNVYRSLALGHYWQSEGLKVVPTLSWAGPDSYAFCFEGVPKRSTVAASTVGVKRDVAALDIWRAGMSEAMRRLAPSRVLLYGGDVGFDFGGCEVVEYANSVTERMANGR